MVNKLISVALALALSPYAGGRVLGQDKKGNSDGFITFEATYVGDIINNLSGGIQTGSTYLGMASIGMAIDIEKAGIWKGGLFYVAAANTNGSSPSSEMLGDLQVVSNIEAGEHTYIQEFWFKQSMGNLELTMGLQDLNVEFANSEHGALFLNSSFGILPIISTNIPAPIFPLTALGVTAKWNISDRISWLNAAYDGAPTDFDSNPYNTKWEFKSGDGLLAITELQYNTQYNSLPTTYKVGLFSHNHLLERNVPDSLNHVINGIYGHIDQMLWANGNRTVGYFLQLGYSPSQKSENISYFGGGLTYSGLLRKGGEDTLGLAIANANFRGDQKSETTLELSYCFPLISNIFVQPDVQYVFNPAGTGELLDNCLTFNIRLGLGF